METPYLILAITFILAPAVVIYLEGKYNILKKIGAVLVCYGIGLAIGNMGVLPEGSDKIQNLLTQITIPLSLPLILFSMDIKKWIRNAGAAFISLFIGIFSVLVVIFIGYWIFKGKIEIKITVTIKSNRVLESLKIFFLYFTNSTMNTIHIPILPKSKILHPNIPILNKNPFKSTGSKLVLQGESL